MKYKFSSEDKLFLNYKGLSWKMPSLKLVLYCVHISFFPFIFLDLLFSASVDIMEKFGQIEFLNFVEFLYIMIVNFKNELSQHYMCG